MIERYSERDISALWDEYNRLKVERAYGLEIFELAR